MFWILTALLPKEKVDRKDYVRIFVASVLGFLTCQVTFLVGIPHITPMDCSIMTSMSPIYTMAIAALVIKEPVTMKMAGGVAISFAGIIYLIICATFITYFLIPVAQKRIRPTLVSIIIGMDQLTWQKGLVAAMVLGGVIIVSYSKSR